MNKNRSWAIKVSMATYDEILRSAGLSKFQLKVSNPGMAEDAHTGDTFYLIKPATTDESTPPDIATTTLVSLGGLSSPNKLLFDFVLSIVVMTIFRHSYIIEINKYK